MNPTSHKVLAQRAAENVGMSPELGISIINHFYGNHIRPILTRVEHPTVYLPKFGTFSVKPWALKRKIDRLEEELSQQTLIGYTPGFVGANLRQKIQELNNFRSIESLIEFETQSQQLIKSKRRHEPHSSLEES